MKFMKSLVALLVLATSGAFAVAQVAPTVTLSASPATGASPLSTTLTWSSTGATNCTASGGWSGTKALSGTQVISGLTANATFTLTCTSPSNNSAVLSWVAPTQNEDTTPITGAITYRVFTGASAAAVGLSAPIASPSGTTFTATGLPVGPNYFGVQAVVGGQVSVMSNIANKTVVAGASGSANASVTVTTKPNPPTGLTVTDVVAYNILKVWGKYYTVKVGTIPLGTSCYDASMGNLHKVPANKVTLKRRPISGVFYAKCA